MALDVDLEGTLLIADGTFGADGLHVEDIFATAQIGERHTVYQGITVAPVFVLAFHPVHELQALTLVVVTSAKLDGERVLVVAEVDLVGLVHGL